MTTGTSRTSQTTTTAKPAEAATMDEYKNSAYYQSLGIDRLQEQLSGYTTDDAALRQQAEAMYRPTYETELEEIRQQLQRQIQGYDSQREGVSASYDRMRRQANAAYDESAVDMSNALTRRGLGRSSLVSTQGAYLENQRNQALSDIGRDENAEITAINEKIALLTDQAAQSERTLAGNYARQLESRVSEWKEQNKSAAVSLQLQIAALQQQGYEAYQEWLRETQEQQLRAQEYELKIQDQQLQERLQEQDQRLREQEYELKEREQALKEKEFDMKYAEEQPSAGGSGGSSSGKKESAAEPKSARKNTLTGQAQKVSGALTTLLSDIKKKVSQAKSGGTSGTSGTTAAKATSAKRQTARE